MGYLILIILIIGCFYIYNETDFFKNFYKKSDKKNSDGIENFKKDLQKYSYLINKKSFLNSKNENYFLLRLNEYLKDKDFIVYPKVRVGDIIDCKTTNKGFRPYSITSRIDRSHIDFVLIRKSNFTIFCAIELDDYSHNSEKAKIKDEAKDILFDFVKIPLIRFNKANVTDEEFKEKGIF